MVGGGSQPSTGAQFEAGSAGNAALAALVATIERRLRAAGSALPPDACLLAHRLPLIAALQGGLLGFIEAVDWATFTRLSRRLSAHGVDGLRAAVGLSSLPALSSGITGAVLATLDQRRAASPASVLCRRLTRSSAGHVVFWSQLVQLADGECCTTPLEMSRLLRCHTPTAIRAMLLGRVIKGRADLDGRERQVLVDRVTQHLGRLLPEADALRCALLLLRLAHYRLQYPIVARHVLRRVRVVDFRGRRGEAARLRV